MITVSGLNKSFNQFPALSDINFTVNKGEVVRLLAHQVPGNPLCYVR